MDMTTTLSIGDDVFAEVTDIIVSPFPDNATKTNDCFDALIKGNLEFTCKVDAQVSFEELTAQLDRLSKPQKPKISERQIWKSLNRRT